MWYLVNWFDWFVVVLKTLFYYSLYAKLLRNVRIVLFHSSYIMDWFHQCLMLVVVSSITLPCVYCQLHILSSSPRLHVSSKDNLADCLYPSQRTRYGGKILNDSKALKKIGLLISFEILATRRNSIQTIMKLTELYQ